MAIAPFFVSSLALAAIQDLHSNEVANQTQSTVNPVIGAGARADAVVQCNNYPDVVNLDLVPTNTGMIDVDADLSKIISDTASAASLWNQATSELTQARNRYYATKSYSGPDWLAKTKAAGELYIQASDLLADDGALANQQMPDKLETARTGYVGARIRANTHSSSTALTNCKQAIEALITEIDDYKSRLMGVASALQVENISIDQDRQNNFDYLLTWSDETSEHPNQPGAEDPLLEVTTSPFTSNPKGIGHNGSAGAGSAAITP